MLSPGCFVKRCQADAEVPLSMAKRVRVSKLSAPQFGWFAASFLQERLPNFRRVRVAAGHAHVASG